MKTVRIVLLGHGTVGRAFASILDTERDWISQRFGLDFIIVGIRTSTLETRLESPQRGAEVQWHSAGDLASFLRDADAGAVVQAIPNDSPQTAYTQVLTAFEAGAEVVTATKSHLARDWARIKAAASSLERSIGVSAAAGAALPAVEMASRGLNGFHCDTIRACVNGTSNFVLSRLAGGAPLAEAIAEAHRLGISEPNPQADLSGADAAAKIVILSNLMWDRAWTIDDVLREPIAESTLVRAAGAAASGRVLRPVATAAAEGPLGVQLVELECGDPLFGLEGAEKAVDFDCGDEGHIVVSGGRSSPAGAARALLKDLINSTISR